MVALIGIPYLVGEIISRRGSLLALCAWNFLFLSNGLLGTVRPVGWLRLMGYPPSKSFSLTVRRMVRFFGIFSFLVGAIGTINLIVNFSGYWKGLY
jgi:hypothetical protein